MDASQREKWSRLRQNGKAKFVIINALVWTPLAFIVVILANLLVSRFVTNRLQALDFRSVREFYSEYDLLARAGFALVLTFANVNRWWNRNERAFNN